MPDIFEVTEKLTLTRLEAALALHALRNYADVKGDIGVDTNYLQSKLEAFIEGGSSNR